MRVGGWAVLSAWSLLLLAWLVLHWGILPRLDEWRPHIERYASHAVGLPVQIGQIEVRSSGWVPALTLSDVVLRDPRGREALRLPRVSAALSVPSLLALHLRFEQLLIDGPRLEIRRDAQGHLRVAGMDMDGEAVGGGGLANWFFEQHEFVIRAGVVRWVDEMRSAPPLELSDVQLVVRNRLQRHDLRLDATPPADWGQRFTLVARARQPLLAPAGDWQRWRGSLHAHLPLVLVSQLRHHVDLPFELAQGDGALRAWVDFEHGLPQGGTVDLALRDVSVRLAAGLEPLALAQVGGRVTVERQADSVRVTATRFGFQTAQGQRWPEGQLALKWTQAQVLNVADLAPSAAARPVTAGEFSAERLDLAVMADLAERLPLGAHVRRLLDELNPQGTVTGLNAAWQGPLDAPLHYQVKADIKGMAMSAAASPEVGGVGRPGWRGADLAFSGTESGGQAQLTIQNGALELPGVFDDPVVKLRRFAANLGWRIEPGAPGRLPKLELKVNAARFENEDVHGDLSATWRTGANDGFGKGGRLPGVLELAGSLKDGQATRVVRYMPLGIAANARQYVRHAVQGGRVESATFKVKGDLWDFPFVQRKYGEFSIAAQLRDVTLAYVPSLPGSATEPAWVSPWPAMSGIDGELLFERTAMQARLTKGRIGAFEFSDVHGGIKNLADQPMLELEGQGRGQASDILRYVNVTPIGDWLSGALAKASAEGAAELKLALNLPLRRVDQTQVKGSVQLLGGDVRLRPDTPTLAGARGRIDFTQRGVQVAGTARAYGGEASIDGGSQADGSLRFNAQGIASAEGLRRASELGPVARWASKASGQAPYRLQMGIARGYPEMLITSPLTGIAFDLPAPLNKAADASLPLRVQLSLAPGSRNPNTPLHDVLRVDLGNLLSAQYLRDLSGDDARVLRGAVALNAPLPEMQPGVRAVADLGSANGDAWLALWPSGAGSDVAPGKGPADAGYLPQSVELKAQALTVAARRLTQLSLQVARADDGWRATVHADQLSGEIGYVPPRGSGDAGRVRARLTRLSLPQSEVEGVEGLLDQAPLHVPALDIEIDDFELRGRKLGKLSVEAVNRSSAGAASAREWRLNRLALQSPEAELVATGQWGQATGLPARRRMGLDFRLQVRDAGALLQRMGFGAVIRNGKGLLQGQISWAGSPTGLDMPTLDGRVNLALDAGQFLKAQPGAGRLLGVLSLQALPRRLALDFRDVFQEGFAFDNITGDVQIASGVARSNNLRMRGVQAAVLMEGSADLMHETQDLRVIVVPEINAGTASLAYAVINPAIGLGTFLGQWLLRGPLAEAATREFKITGAWADPQMVQVARRPGAAASAAAARAPAAAVEARPAAAESAPVGSPVTAPPPAASAPARGAP